MGLVRRMCDDLVRLVGCYGLYTIFVGHNCGWLGTVYGQSRSPLLIWRDSRRERVGEGVIHMESDGAFAKNSPFFKGQTAASRFISATALLFARKDSIILRNDSRG